MNDSELKDILEKHLKWLKKEKDGKRADLCGIDLRGIDLCGANIRSANLCGVNLSSVDLRGADLCGVNLHSANLGSADLRGANLCDADLRGANLCYADLCDADLRGANIHGANLIGANIRGASNIYYPLSCPEFGEFIGWKKCANGAIVKLIIPADAKRSSANSRKCRASKVIVDAVYDKDYNEIEEAKSVYDSKIIYRKGEIVEPVNGFDENRWNECAPGIHFFMTKEEAKRY